PAFERQLAPFALARARRSTQVDADERPAGEPVADPVPERARQAEAVHEHERRPLAVDLHVELGAPDVDQLPRLRRRSVHAHLHQPRLSTASTIAATVGAYTSSSDGVNGTGACGAVTRLTGAFRRSNAVSVTTAAISDATLHCGGLSSTTTSAPVFATDST